MAKCYKHGIPRMTSVAELSSLALEGASYRDWYAQAKAEIVRAAINMPDSRELYIRINRLAALLSLFSPRVSVSRSCKFALTYAKTGQFLYDVMGDTRRAVEHWEFTGEIRGPKTSEFYRALMGEPDACVLDVWMGVALGINSKRFHDSKTVYAAGAKRLRAVADIRGWTVAQTQAAIWSATVLQNRAEVPHLLLASIVAGPLV